MGLNPRRVLVIDDEEVVGAQVSVLLARHSFLVEYSATDVEAFAAAARSMPDVVLLDLALSDRSGDMSGMGTLQRWKKRYPSVPVIVMTKYHMPVDVVVDCMKLGAYYYILKESFAADGARLASIVDHALSEDQRYNHVEERFPQPIALLFRDYRRNVVAPQLKVARGIELLDVLLRWCTAVALMDVLSHASDVSLAREFLGTNGFKPSLGSWNARLGIMLDTHGGLQWISQLQAVFARHSRKQVAGMVELRNEVIGHGASRSEREYERIIDSWRRPLLELMGRAAVLGSWNHFAVRSTKLMGPGRYEHELQDLSGHNPRLLTATRAMEVAVRAGHVYVENEMSQEVLSLHPFVVVDTCDECGQQHIFVLDKVDKQRVYYLDFVYGHHSRSDLRYRDYLEVVELARGG